jgi:hypothetical protein
MILSFDALLHAPWVPLHLGLVAFLCIEAAYCHLMQERHIVITS